MTDPGARGPSVRGLLAGRRFGALGILPLLAALWLVVAAARIPILTPDVWWHLATGRWIATRHAIPHSDPFSYTLAGKRWTTHEWLADVALHAAQSAGGLAGVVLLRAALLVAAFAMAYRAARLHAGAVLSIGVLLLAGYASQRNWLDRPQLWTYVLAPLLLVVLERQRSRRGWRLWTLPVLFLVWVNLHGGFVLGLAILGLWLAAGWSAARREGAEAWRRWRHVLFAGSLAIAAALVNPNGGRGLLYPLRYESSAWRASIQEERVGALDSPYAWVHFGLLLALAAVLVWRWRRTPAEHRALGLALAWISMPRLGGVALPLAAERHAPLFLLVGVPLLVWQLQALAGPRWERGEQRLASALACRPARGAALAIAALAFVLVARAWPRDGSPEARLLPGRFPTAAVRWLQANPLPGNLVNPYRWGGYLIFNLWPEYKVWIDSRGDLYGAQRLREDDLLYHLPPGSEPAAQALLERYDADVIVWYFLSLDSGELRLHPLARWLLGRPEWRLVFVDWSDTRRPKAPAGTTAIFLRQTARNRELLQRYQPVRLPSGLPR